MSWVAPSPAEAHRVFRPMHHPQDQQPSDLADHRRRMGEASSSLAKAQVVHPSTPAQGATSRLGYSSSDVSLSQSRGSSQPEHPQGGLPSSSGRLLPASSRASGDGPCLERRTGYSSHSSLPSAKGWHTRLSDGSGAIGRADSLTHDWLAAPRPEESRGAAGQSYVPTRGSSIEFPKLSRDTLSTENASGVHVVAPELGALGLGPPLPWEEEQEQQWKPDCPQSCSSRSSRVSSVDMPYDVSLNNTQMLPWAGTGMTPFEFYSMMSGSPEALNMPWETSPHLQTDASPLARQPPLVEVHMPWHGMEIRDTGVAGRLRRATCVSRDIAGSNGSNQVRELEEENRRLREQLEKLQF